MDFDWSTPTITKSRTRPRQSHGKKNTPAQKKKQQCIKVNLKAKKAGNPKTTETKMKKVDPAAKVTNDIIGKLSMTQVPKAVAFKNPGCALTVGSACSGWGSELLALEQLGIPYCDVFGCDCNLDVAMLFKHLHKPQHFFSDVMEAGFQKAPHVQLFLAGFPCQPWAAGGLHQAFADPRGVVVFYILHYIAVRLPTVWILENVGGIIKYHLEEFCYLLQLCSEITDPNIPKKSAYEVKWFKMNAQDYNIPQNRERVFIVGRRIAAIKTDIILAPKAGLD